MWKQQVVDGHRAIEITVVVVVNWWWCGCGVDFNLLCVCVDDDNLKTCPPPSSYGVLLLWLVNDYLLVLFYSFTPPTTPDVNPWLSPWTQASWLCPPLLVTLFLRFPICLVVYNIWTKGILTKITVLYKSELQFWSTWLVWILTFSHSFSILTPMAFIAGFISIFIIGSITI